MNSKLIKIRDKMAEKADEQWQKESYDGGYCTLSYKQGFDAAHELLMKDVEGLIEALEIFSNGEGQASPSKIYMNRKSKDLLKQWESKHGSKG